MKALKCASILLAFMALLLAGCSNEGESPVTPTDQSIQAPAALQKNIIRRFTSEEGPNLANPGLILDPPRIADGKTFYSLRENTYFEATFLDPGPDFLSGDGVVEMNSWIDNNTLEGFTWGKLTITPKNPAAKGVWEITWHGKMWVDQSTGQSIAPLKWVGHGKGGAVNGMQFYCDDTITMTSPVAWKGEGGTNCYIKEH